MQRKVFCILFVFSFLPLLFSCDDPGGKPRTANCRRDDPTVRVKNVNKVKQQAVVAAAGTIEAQETLEVAFQVPGKVAQVFIREGDTVKANQILAEVDPTKLKQAVDAAIARAAGTRLRAAHTEEQYRRMKRLYEKKGLAPSEFKKFETAHLASKTALRRAEAHAAIARKELTNTRLLAPIKGVIAKRMVAPGDTVSAGTPVFTIVDVDRVNVRIRIPGNRIEDVRVKQSATVRVPELPRQTFEGEVEAAGKTADPDTGMFGVTIGVPNPRRTLLGGMAADVRIQTDAVAEVLTVPVEAVLHDPQGQTIVYVYSPDQKKVFARQVDTGSRQDGNVEIAKGLTGNETVVISGQDHLADGAATEHVEPQ